MSRAAHIKVTGLREFGLAVKNAADAEPKLMTKGLNEVGQVVVDNAIPLMKSQFVSDPELLTGDLEKSIRAQSTERTGRVLAGYPSKVPYAGLWEFGGFKPPRRPYNRPFVKRGRSLYPALDDHEAEVLAAMERVLTQLAEIIDKG